MRTFLPSLPLLLVFSTVLEGTLTKPFVYMVYTQNATCVDFKAVPACFGAALPRAGLTGFLVEAVPANACHPIRAPPALKGSPPGFIVLIRRYGCSFGMKVLHAQQAGYRAAVIHNLYSDLLVSMAREENESRQKILIPSLFIGGSASKLLRRWMQLENHTKLTVVVPRSYHNPCWDKMDLAIWDTSRHYFQFWPGYCGQRMIVGFLQEFGIAILLSMGFSFFLFAACLKWYRQSRGIHVKTFRRGDQYDSCVICMSEYEVGDRLKILPCGHAYHNTCINTWLVIQPRTEKTCPICKQKVNAAL